MGEKKRLAEEDSSPNLEEHAAKSAKKEKKRAKTDTKEDASDVEGEVAAATAKAERKAAKKRAKDHEEEVPSFSGGGGGKTSDRGGATEVARVRVSGIPPNADAAKVAAFLGIVDVAGVSIVGGEALAVMPSAAAALHAATNLNETKLAGRFVQVAQDFLGARADDLGGGGDAGAGGTRGGGGVGDLAGSSGVGRAAEGEVVEVECAGQTGRIIGKGGAKIREIEEMTGCFLRIRKDDGVCEVSGRDMAAAVQEIKNIVEEGRERDSGGGAGFQGLQGSQQPQRFGSGGVGGAVGGVGGEAEGRAGQADANAAPESTAAPTGLPFGMPPPGSASRHDSGANDWACPCSSVNFARRDTCFRCHAPRAFPDGQGPASAGAGRGGSGGGVCAIATHNPAAASAHVPAWASGEGGAPPVDTTAAADGFEVFVKYLPHTAEEAEVAALFSQFGGLSGEVRLMRHPSTGQCKGAGFVSFATEQGRQVALSKDGVKFGGRHLSITEAKTGTFGVRATEQAFGTHTPAMLQEAVRAMVAQDVDGTYVDGTFGRGGHTRGILASLSAKGRLHAFDMDPEAIAEARKLEAEDSRFTIHHAPFGCMDAVLAPLGVSPSGVFLDLGISSPQFDNQSRGFRPEQDGPLDLRFDATRGEPASAYLQHVGRDELIAVLEKYGETSDPTAARRVADAVCLARDEGRLPSRTREFAALVAAAKGKSYLNSQPQILARES